MSKQSEALEIKKFLLSNSLTSTTHFDKIGTLKDIKRNYTKSCKQRRPHTPLISPRYNFISFFPILLNSFTVLHSSDKRETL